MGKAGRRLVFIGHPRTFLAGIYFPLLCPPEADQPLADKEGVGEVEIPAYSMRE